MGDDIKNKVGLTVDSMQDGQGFLVDFKEEDFSTL